MTAIDDRFRRAREAYWDSPEGMAAAALESAIEAAIRVQITDEVIAAAGLARGGSMPSDTAGLRAAFEAAGFEVVE